MHQINEMTAKVSVKLFLYYILIIIDKIKEPDVLTTEPLLKYLNEKQVKLHCDGSRILSRGQGGRGGSLRSENLSPKKIPAWKNKTHLTKRMYKCLFS